jgi:striatin 1/3/4
MINNNDGGLVPTNIAEVMDKFNQSLRKLAIKETEWLDHKSNYETRIAELEGQLKAHENINIDLLKRIRMLEYALQIERYLKIY